ncbi:Elongator subunit elp4 [Entomophthora muscae]|uniref:Elongator subunit elp4 n=1 Tax=Entomophthora muscae TaxID=34485 RepID=A0ACC2UGB7_9FUNG|nr:Elongator subunit elp4 [Entomophthora muscae]
MLRHSFATAMVTFPAHLHAQTQCRAVFNLADLVMEFRSFADSPDAQPSEYHGLFYLHKTPQVNNLMSMGLRTVSSAAPSRTAAGGSTTTNTVTNDLGFKLKRKKLVIETFHLPIEGGVSDRRTEPPKDSSEPRRFTAPNRPAPTKSSPIDF